jgi:hypothetical protein
LVHIKTESIGSGVSSVSVNDVFSATYQNYLVLGVNVKSASNDINLRMRVGGADESGSIYSRQRLIGNSTTVTSTRDTGRTSLVVGEGSTVNSGFEFILFNPFETTTINLHSRTSHGGTSPVIQFENGFVNNSTSYTGFTLIASSGTFSSGQIRVYGLAN